MIHGLAQLVVFWKMDSPLFFVTIALRFQRYGNLSVPAAHERADHQEIYSPLVTNVCLRGLGTVVNENRSGLVSPLCMFHLVELDLFGERLNQEEDIGGVVGFNIVSLHRVL